MKKRKVKSGNKGEIKSGRLQKFLIPSMYFLLALVIVLIYGKTVFYDFAIDDKIVIVGNSFVNEGLTGFGNLVKAAFDQDATLPGVTRPVSMFSHALDVSIFGMAPGPMHFMNVLFYLILIFLLFYFLKNILLQDLPVFLAFGIVLLFAVHPVHVETVANIKGRDDILCFIFGVLALIFFFRQFQAHPLRNRILSLVFLVLSFLSKETGVVFAVLIPLTYYFFDNSDLKKIVRKTYPYLIAAAVWILLRVTFFKDPSTHINIFNNSLLALEDPVQRLAMTLRVLLHYIQLSFWPNPLSWDYSLGFFEFNTFTNGLAIISLILYGGLTALAAMGLKMKNRISYGIFFFLIALFPVSNLIIPIASTFGERLLFIPSFGFAFAFVFLLHSLNQKVFPTLSFRKVNPLIFTVLLVSTAFFVLSAKRAQAWKNDDGLVSRDYPYCKSLRNSRSYVQYLTALPGDQTQNYQNALEVCNEALTRFGDDWQLWYFKGVISRFFNKPDDAKHAYRNVLVLKEDHFFTLANLGLLVSKEDPDQAIDLFRKAIEIEPNDALIIGNLAMMLHNKGELVEAKALYERSLRIDPSAEGVKNGYRVLMESF